MAGEQESVLRAENGHESQQAELAPPPSPHTGLTILRITANVLISLGSCTSFSGRWHGVFDHATEGGLKSS